MAKRRSGQGTKPHSSPSSRGPQRNAAHGRMRGDQQTASQAIAQDSRMPNPSYPGTSAGRNPAGIERKGPQSRPMGIDTGEGRAFKGPRMSDAGRY